MVLAKRPGRAWRLGMLCGRAGGQERCAFDAIVDNERTFIGSVLLIGSGLG